MKLRRRCQQLGLCLFFPCLSFSFACLDPCLCCLFVVVVCFVFYHGLLGSKSFLFLFSITECLDQCLSCLVFVCLFGWLVFVSRSVWIHIFLVLFFCFFVLCITECLGSMSFLFSFSLFVCLFCVSRSVGIHVFLVSFRFHFGHVDIDVCIYSTCAFLTVKWMLMLVMYSEPRARNCLRGMALYKSSCH